MFFVLQTANVTADAKNCVYPNRKEIQAGDDLKEAVRFDHVCGEFKKNYRNMKYENMRKYIETVAKNDEEKNKALAEFERQHALACIKPSPYHAMVEWFEETYGNVKFPDTNENDNESAKTVEAA